METLLPQPITYSAIGVSLRHFRALMRVKIPPNHATARLRRKPRASVYSQRGQSYHEGHDSSRKVRGAQNQPGSWLTVHVASTWRKLLKFDVHRYWCVGFQILTPLTPSTLTLNIFVSGLMPIKEGSAARVKMTGAIT